MRCGVTSAPRPFRLESERRTGGAATHRLQAPSSPPTTFAGLESMIKHLSKKALEAAICIVALGILKRIGLAKDVSTQQVVRRLDVSRSYAYELVPKVKAALEHEPKQVPVDEADANTSQTFELKVRNAVLEYRVDHPGAWVCGGRTTYSKDLVAFILDLAAQSLGPSMTQAEFANACGVPLPTLKDWWADAASQSPLLIEQEPKPEPPGPEPGPGPAPEPEPGPEPGPPEPEPEREPEPREAEPEPTDADTLGLSSDMLRIVSEYENWHGTLPAFVQHLHSLGIHHGRELVTQILHLAAARKLLRRPPPKPAARGATFRPPAGLQWSSDGKQLDVAVDDQTLRVTWQPTIDVGSTAIVGSVVRSEETTEGVRASFAEGVETTGKAPAAVLLDNKACNKSPQLAKELAPDTFIMHSTPGRPQNNAVAEGSFGLFSQALGPVIATVNTSSPKTIALSVAEAVTRAYAAGRNHHPRRSNGRTPYKLHRDANHSAEEIAAATQRLVAIKRRIDEREAREQARLDPAVQALIEHACQRFDFFDDGDIAISLRTLPLSTMQAAIAIYAAKQQAQSLPPDAGIRYFAGIARNVQHERELHLFEENLVDQLARTEKLVNDHLERKATTFASLDWAGRLLAIVRELLIVRAPAAQVFWRRHFQTVALNAPSALHHALRRCLCERVRRHYASTKQHRQYLIDMIVRSLTAPQTAFQACQA